jgi:hypothetical protein
LDVEESVAGRAYHRTKVQEAMANLVQEVRMWSGSGDTENLAGGRGRRGTGAPAVGGEDRGAEDQRRGLARPAQGSSCHRRTARARSSRRVAWDAGAVTPATETLDGGAWGVAALWRRGCEPWRRGLEEEKEAEPRRRAAVLEKAGNCWSRGGGGRSGRARRGGARASEGGRGPGLAPGEGGGRGGVG